MTDKTLNRAKGLKERLDFLKKGLKKVQYTQSENVSPRISFFSFNGVDESIEVPSILFRTIGKLIESEYISEINKLEKEFEEL